MGLSLLPLLFRQTPEAAPGVSHHTGGVMALPPSQGGPAQGTSVMWGCQFLQSSFGAWGGAERARLTLLMVALGVVLSHGPAVEACSLTRCAGMAM